MICARTYKPLMGKEKTKGCMSKSEPRMDTAIAVYTEPYESESMAILIPIHNESAFTTALWALIEGQNDYTCEAPYKIEFGLRPFNDILERISDGGEIWIDGIAKGFLQDHATIRHWNVRIYPLWS